LIVLTGIVGAALAVLVPIYRWQSRRAHAMNNLRQIVVALHNYHDVFGTFPPAYVCDSSGAPAHSWRTLIYPYFDGSPLPYQLAEPWNGPNNAQIAKQTPLSFRLRHDRSTADGMTNYVAIVGPDTMWPGDKPLKLQDTTDGTSYTILIVEITNSDIPWTAPRDLPVEEFEAWLDPMHEPQIGFEIEGGFIACADGSVHYVPRTATIAEWRQMLSPAGNEPSAIQQGRY
jgi:hypothetical protein